MEKLRPTKSYKGSSKPHTIMTNGEEVTVTTEVHLGYNRPEWTEKKRKSRDRRCIDETTGNRCTKKSCNDCDIERAAQELEPKEKISPTISLEKAIEDGFDYAASRTTEEIAAENFLMEAFEDAIADMDAETQDILRLFVDLWPERAIKDEVGCTLYRVNSTIKKHKPVLQERMAEVLGRGN